MAAPSPTPSTAVGLSWVLVDGLPRHVTEFAALPARRRPDAICPQCGRHLILKLGTVRRHHAAHEAGWRCPATRAETALHIDCKLALATALRSAHRRVLSIRRRCVGAGDETCDRIDIREWCRDWDEVAIESRMDDAYRPDIVLARDRRAIAALEILVTNAVSDEKSAALAASGLPWIEILATEELTLPKAWTPDAPLDVVRAGTAEPWRCVVHAARQRVLLAAAKQSRAEKRDRERDSIVLRAARVVDVYHPNGARERLIYRVVELRRDGRPRALRLTRGTLVLAELSMDDGGDVHALVREAFHADTEHLCREGAFADSPMRWASADAAEFIVEDAPFDRGGGGSHNTVLETTYPRRWFFAPGDRRWFLPRDMRDVRWDRPAGDAFGAHPAWHGHRGAVAERPAPEGSWQTPIFARTPIAAMFTAGIFAPANEDGIAVIELGERAIVVLERAVDRADAIESIARDLDARHLEAIWLSHPRDWRPVLEDVAWTPAGRDARGFGAVLVDGVGVFRADAFARVLSRGDPRLRAERIRSASERRVAALASARR